MKFTDDQIERYSRHIILSEIGGEGQARLFNSKVLVIGAGGLGSPLLYYLVGSGVGRVGIVEGDQVELSNLPRQILYNTGDAGKKKVLVARERLSELNPDVSIDVYDMRLSEENCRGVIEGYDLIIDCTDNFESRFLINSLAIRSNKPLLSGAVVRFEGNVMLVIPRKTFCYNCIFDRYEGEHQQITCLNSGVLSSVVGTIATIMASEAIKYLLGLGTIENYLLKYDARTQDVRKIYIRRNPYCETCA